MRVRARLKVVRAGLLVALSVAACGGEGDAVEAEEVAASQEAYQWECRRPYCDEETGGGCTEPGQCPGTIDQGCQFSHLYFPGRGFTCLPPQALIDTSGVTPCWNRIVANMDGSDRIWGPPMAYVQNLIRQHCSNGKYCVIGAPSGGAARVIWALATMSPAEKDGVLNVTTAGSAAGGTPLAEKLTEGWIKYVAKLFGADAAVDEDLTRQAARSSPQDVGSGIPVDQFAGTHGMCKKVKIFGITVYKICSDSIFALGAGSNDGYIGLESACGCAIDASVENSCDSCAKYPNRWGSAGYYNHFDAPKPAMVHLAGIIEQITQRAIADPNYYVPGYPDIADPGNYPDCDSNTCDCDAESWDDLPWCGFDAGQASGQIVTGDTCNGGCQASCDGVPCGTPDACGRICSPPDCCQPQCDPQNTLCGDPDGCGGQCWSNCCTPDCDGKFCGAADGCGGTCTHQNSTCHTPCSTSCAGLTCYINMDGCENTCLPGSGCTTGQYYAPIGFLEQVGWGGGLTGWACDHDNPMQSVQVELWVGGNGCGQGTRAAVLTANQPNNDAPPPAPSIEAFCRHPLRPWTSGGTAHRFSFILNHCSGGGGNCSGRRGDKVYACARDLGTGNLVPIAQSGRRWGDDDLPADNGPPIHGWLDQVTSSGRVKGWVCDSDRFSESLQVRCRVDGHAGQDYMTANLWADPAQRPGVIANCGGTNYHLFDLQLNRGAPGGTVRCSVMDATYSSNPTGNVRWNWIPNGNGFTWPFPGIGN